RCSWLRRWRTRSARPLDCPSPSRESRVHHPPDRTPKTAVASCVCGRAEVVSSKIPACRLAEHSLPHASPRMIVRASHIPTLRRLLLASLLLLLAVPAPTHAAPV